MLEKFITAYIQKKLRVTCRTRQVADEEAGRMKPEGKAAHRKRMAADNNEKHVLRKLEKLKNVILEQWKMEKKRKWNNGKKKLKKWKMEKSWKSGKVEKVENCKNMEKMYKWGKWKNGKEKTVEKWKNEEMEKVEKWGKWKNEKNQMWKHVRNGQMVKMKNGKF